MIIILNGLMGSGKSTIGKALSKTLSYNFIDLDKQIEKLCNMPISSIFNEKGEDFFRNQEEITLKEILNKHDSNLVLSLGGGTFKNNNNINLCLKKGIVIWLNLNIEIIADRLKDFSSRPLLKNSSSVKDTLKELLSQRFINYSKSHIKLDLNKNYPKKDIVNLIISSINDYTSGK